MTATVIVLGLLTALAYGACDYFGGLAMRRAQASLAVVVLFHLVALVLFAAAMPVVGGSASAAAIGWGALAGLGGGLGYLSYFRALAAGRMGVVATVTAIWSALVPLLVGLALGERPSPLAWAGILAVLVAIVLVTLRLGDGDPPHETATPSAGYAPIRSAPASPAPASPALASPARLAAGVPAATAGGVAFGGFFVALDRAGAAEGTIAWPMLAAAASGAVLVGIVALLRRVDWRAARRHAPAVIAAGALHAAGTLAFVLAVRDGWVSIVAVVAALSPAPTMLLARLLLREKLTFRQLLGVPLALAGIALLVAAVTSPSA